MAIDYILIDNRYRCQLKDPEVILGEEVLSQYCLLVMNILLRKEVKRRKRLRKNLKLWMFKESDVEKMFAEVIERCDGYENCSGLQKNLLNLAREVWITSRTIQTS